MGSPVFSIYLLHCFQILYIVLAELRNCSSISMIKSTGAGFPILFLHMNCAEIQSKMHGDLCWHGSIFVAWISLFNLLDFQKFMKSVVSGPRDIAFEMTIMSVFLLLHLTIFRWFLCSIWIDMKISAIKYITAISIWRDEVNVGFYFRTRRYNRFI